MKLTVSLFGQEEDWFDERTMTVTIERQTGNSVQIVSESYHWETCKNCGKRIPWRDSVTPHILGVLCSEECLRENEEHYR